MRVKPHVTGQRQGRAVGLFPAVPTEQSRAWSFLMDGTPLLCFAAGGLIQVHGRSDQCLERGLIDLLAFPDVDGPPDVPVETRVEES